MNLRFFGIYVFEYAVAAGSFRRDFKLSVPGEGLEGDCGKKKRKPTKSSSAGDDKEIWEILK